MIFTVQNCPGYNSWPMLQNIGSRLVCVYSRGTKHEITEPPRALFARISDDGARSWQTETLIVNTPDRGDVPIGKGLDENGNMLLWNRSAACFGSNRKGALRHSLYRTSDGIRFTLIAQPELDPEPMQITDIFHISGRGMMALWFAGTYQDDDLSSWGILVSSDNGRTWAQTVIEANLPRIDWPTEPSALYLGNGHIFAIARTESGPAQFQLESHDSGRTWTKLRTNISDVMMSTPSLLLDRESGVVSNYYYQRSRGLLKLRRTPLKNVIGNPTAWPEPEIIAEGSPESIDAGNVNAVSLNGRHYIAYYSGKWPDTAVFMAETDGITR